MFQSTAAVLQGAHVWDIVSFKCVPGLILKPSSLKTKLKMQFTEENRPGGNFGENLQIQADVCR